MGSVLPGVCTGQSRMGSLIVSGTVTGVAKVEIKIMSLNFKKERKKKREKKREKKRA